MKLTQTTTINPPAIDISVTGQTPTPTTSETSTPTPTTDATITMTPNPTPSISPSVITPTMVSSSSESSSRSTSSSSNSSSSSVNSSSSSSANSSTNSLSSNSSSSNTTEKPSPNRSIIKKTYDAFIKSPLLSFLQQPASTYQYSNSTISKKTSISLIVFSILLLIISFFIFRKMTNIFGKFWYILFIIGILILIGTVYLGSSFQDKTRNFSSYTLLTSSWDNYKSRFIAQDGSVVDKNGIVTSEAQSYAMLQSVWLDDQETFNRVWEWTNATLKRKSDALFGWRFGTLSGNKKGFLPDGGENSASDADSDIAYSLILASRRWHNQNYKKDAIKILNSIWDIEVATISGRPYLIAGNWAHSESEVVINPSYFAPYAWREFAKEDIRHNWTGLIDPAYDLLFQVGKHNLDKQKSVGLPPDWVSLDSKTGEILSVSPKNLTTNYSFDAMRIPWRISLDYVHNKSRRALAYVKSLDFLVSTYKTKGKLGEGYSHDGVTINENQSPAMYATSIGMFTLIDPILAKKIYENKILNLYSTDSNSFKKDLPYYDENWLWFGAALYLNSLPLYK